MKRAPAIVAVITLAVTMAFNQTAIRTDLSARLSGMDEVQLNTLQKLEKSSKSEVRVTFDQQQKIPRFITARVPVAQALSDEGAAYQFLHEYKELFKLENPADQLSLKVVVKDALGSRHVRMGQNVNGIPVFGKEVYVHINGDGEVYAVNGNLSPRLEQVETTPSIRGEEAVKAAIAHIGPAVYRWETDLENYLPEGKSWRPSAELVIYEAGREALLAYHTIIAIEEPEPANWVYFINAQTAEVLHRYNDIQHVDAVGTGSSLYKGTVDVGTNDTGSGYELKDNVRNLWTYDAENKRRLPGSMFTDADNSWGDGTNANRQSAAVDAHWGAATTFDYYWDSHGRNGLDDAGLRITSSVHYKRNEVNAYWNGAQVLYGDGDGVNAGPLVDLDVVSHELTHGVTDHTADLIYQNQSGALNESMSDVFAMMIDTDDYWIGEDSWTPGTAGDALRYMDDPNQGGQPMHMDEIYTGSGDNGGVHTNSGIPNFAAYLATAGGTGKHGDVVTGVGRASIGAVWYRALSVYLFASAEFIDARAATVQSATDLFGDASAEVQSVNAAWDAVGVTDVPPPPPPGGDWEGTFVSYPVSTPHPYRNRRTYSYTITHSGATGMKVNFTAFDTEAGWDFVSIKDGSGTTVTQYSGNLGAFISAAVDGETIIVELVADRFVNGYGFDIDGYYYRDATGAFAGGLPGAPELRSNYPNPFNPSTTIVYQLPDVERVSLKIYNINGQEVTTLVDGLQPANTYAVVWDGKDAAGRAVSSGVYIYRLQAGETVRSRRMHFLK